MGGLKMSIATYIDKNLYNIGDHLIVERTMYTHHGLYAGNGKVIENLLTHGIVYVSLEDFSAGAPINIRKHPCPRFNGIEALHRAQSRLGEHNYNLVTFNCEHFVNWCIEGVEVSRQVDNTLALLEPISQITDNLPVIGKITKEAREKSIMGHLCTDPKDHETSAHFDVPTQVRHMQEDILGENPLVSNGLNILFNLSKTCNSSEQDISTKLEEYLSKLRSENNFENIKSIEDILNLALNTKRQAKTALLHKHSVTSLQQPITSQS